MRKKIFEKFQSQGFEVIHNVSTSILILQVIVIERAHSCHQICNILSSLLWCCFIIWPETPDGYNDCNHNNDWCAISQAHWHAWDGIHMYVLVMDRVPGQNQIFEHFSSSSEETVFRGVIIPHTLSIFEKPNFSQFRVHSIN